MTMEERKVRQRRTTGTYAVLPCAHRLATSTVQLNKSHSAVSWQANGW